MPSIENGRSDQFATYGLMGYLLHLKIFGYCEILIVFDHQRRLLSCRVAILAQIDSSGIRKLHYNIPGFSKSYQ